MDGVGDLLGDGFAFESFYERKGKVDCGAEALGGGDMSVGDERQVARVWEVGSDGGVGGSLAVFENAVLGEDFGSGAEGGDVFARFVLFEQEFAEGRVLEQVEDARAAGKDDEVELFGFEQGEGGVGGEAYLVSSGDGALSVEGGDGYFDVGAAEDVDRGERFDFFDAVEDDDEGLGGIGGHFGRVKCEV